MKDLWAPWRKEFILGPKIEGCIFCKLPKQKKDRDNLILFRGKHNFIILNRFPYNNGHLMVVPYRHTKDMSRLKDPENAEMLIALEDEFQAHDVPGRHFEKNGRESGSGRGRSHTL